MRDSVALDFCLLGAVDTDTGPWQIVNDDLERAYKQLEDFVYKPADA